MSWTWGDPIDADTDVFDLNLINSIGKAIHERYLAAYGTDPGTYDPWGYGFPTIPEKLPGDPPYKAGYTTDPLTLSRLETTPWTVSDLQFMVSRMVFQFARRQEVEAGDLLLQPVVVNVSQSLPLAFHPWTYDDRGGGYGDLREALGYPPDSTVVIGVGISFYPRRKCPRRIGSLTATYAVNQRSTVPAQVGNRAELYEGANRDPGLVNYSPFSGESWAPYRGVYECTAPGVWEPCTDRNALPDTLDSNEPQESINWTRPGTFEIGDYAGWWLWRDLYECCKLFKTTVTYAYIGLDGNPPYNKEIIKRGASYAQPGYPSTGASEGDAKSAAAANFATSTDFYDGSAFGGMLIFETTISPMGVGGASAQATLKSTRGQLSAHVYRGIGRTIDYYGINRYSDSTVPGFPTQYHHDDSMGTGAGNNVFGLMDSSHFEASSPSQDLSWSRIILPDWPVPGWGTTTGYGDSLKGVQVIANPASPYPVEHAYARVTWDFAYPSDAVP